MFIMNELTPQEEQLMRFIWQYGKGFVKDYRELDLGAKPPYTTVATIIKKLENKGYVRSKMYGNTYEYTPKIKESDYKKTFFSSAVSNFFGNSYKEMVTFFASEEKLSEKDLEEILEMIKNKN
jgi:predicted transcriptional regulator